MDESGEIRHLEMGMHSRMTEAKTAATIAVVMSNQLG